MIDKTMLARGDGIVVGVSGGADSVALLNLLAMLKDEYALTLYAAHINHCLRGNESDEDENFVRALCEELGVPLSVARVDVNAEAKQQNITLEEAGRQCRYAFFNAVLQRKGANKIAVAHNMDDNAETVLLNLCRGTGLKGLCGIPPVRKEQGAAIIRPLLNTPRGEIEKFLQDNNIPFRRDRTNFENDYTRNRVRLNILPALAEQVNENTVANIARNTEALRAEEDFMAEAAETAYQSALLEGAPAEARFSVTKLTALHEALTRRVMRMAYKNTCGTVKDLSRAHIEMAMDILRGRAGRTARLPLGVCVRKDYGALVFSAELTEPRAENKTLCVPLEPGKPVYVPGLKKSVVISQKPMSDAANACTKAFRCDRVNPCVTLRTWMPGDKITLKGVGTRKLQDYFTDRKIPRGERTSIPLLASGSEIIWILDEAGRVNERYAPNGAPANLYVCLF